MHSRRLVHRAAAAAIALALAVLGVVLAGPAAASAVSNPTFSGSSQVANASNVTWTVGFTPSAGALKRGDAIVVTFASGFVVPTSPTVTYAGGIDAACTPSATGSGTVVTITLGDPGNNGNCLTGGAVLVTIAGTTNPGPGSYTLKVRTSQDTQDASGNVTIIGAAAKLAFTTSPSTPATAGAAFATQPVVAVQDSSGATVTADTSQVQLALTSPGGATLSCTANPKAAASGVATFAGCSVDKAGTYTLTATDGALTSAVSTSFTVTAAATSKLAFVQTPSDAFAGSAMTPAVTVQLQDPFGNAVSTNGVTVTLTPSAGSIGSGGSATTNAAGLATFTGLDFNSTVLGATLSAQSGALTPATSGSFNVTVRVTAAANTLTDTAADAAGSGVKSVSYYFCAGYSGSCSSGTLIGTSTTSGNGYLVNWTGQPVNGSYRVVAVGTDNVGNAAVSAPTPVTVSN